MPPRVASLRPALMAVAALALLSGMAAGLVRLGWALGWPATSLAGRHGPLMVSGSLGTLISLERAVGLGRPWAYAAPALAGLGTLGVLAGAPPPAGPLLISGAGGVLTAIYVALYRMRPARPTAVLGAGALAWWVSGVLWATGAPVARLVAWWAGFLVLTIAGERLELAHVALGAASAGHRQPWEPAGRGGRPRLAGRAFDLALTLLWAGLVLSVLWPVPGVRLVGLGMAGLGAWMLRYDVAWRTIRQPGLARYIAVCLLAGHGWLAAGGAMWAAWAERFGAGAVYDAMLHAIFLGFVMSMIFGHAPVILPAVLGRPVPFTRWFYLPLLMLHASLVLRVAGDLAALVSAARWGGLLNVAAVLGFLAQTAAAARAARARRPAAVLAGPTLEGPRPSP